MLAIEIAELVMDAVNTKVAPGMLTMEDALKMETIPQNSKLGGHIILALQKQNLTILVWIQYNKIDGAYVKHVQTCSW